MHCPRCGTKAGEGDLHCGNCGEKLIWVSKSGSAGKTNELHGSEVSSSGWGWLTWWKLKNEDITYQAENYHNLGVRKSYRGVSLLLTIFSVVITLLFSLSGTDMGIIDAFILLVLGILIYFGYKWASLAAMIFWTFEKGYQVVASFTAEPPSFPFMAVVFWGIYMGAFYSAYKVEARRAAIKNI